MHRAQAESCKAPVGLPPALRGRSFLQRREWECGKPGACHSQRVSAGLEPRWSGPRGQTQDPCPTARRAHLASNRTSTPGNPLALGVRVHAQMRPGTPLPVPQHEPNLSPVRTGRMSRDGTRRPALPWSPVIHAHPSGSWVPGLKGYMLPVSIQG